MIKIGTCYRPNIHDTILNDLLNEIDFLEIMPDILTASQMKTIKKECLNRNIPTGLHTLKASLFSNDQPNLERIKEYYLTSKYFNSEYYSDHVSFSEYNDFYLGTVHQIKYEKQQLIAFSQFFKGKENPFNENECLFLIENIVQDFSEANNEIPFYNKTLTENKGLSFLFDITNAYVSAEYKQLSFGNYIKDFNFSKVDTIHVSGYSFFNNLVQDTHSTNLDDVILDKLDYVLQESSPRNVLVERDFNPDNDNLLEDIYKLKEVCNGK